MKIGSEDVAEEACPSLEDVRDLARMLKGIAYEVSGTSGLRSIETSLLAPPTVQCDRQAVAGMMTQLLSCAVAHPERRKPVSFSCRVAAGQLVLVVRVPQVDVGPSGMPWFSSKGVALILANAHGVVNAHAGSLGTAVDYTGASVVLRIPVRQRQAASWRSRRNGPSATPIHGEITIRVVGSCA